MYRWNSISSVVRSRKWRELRTTTKNLYRNIWLNRRGASDCREGHRCEMLHRNGSFGSTVVTDMTIAILTCERAVCWTATLLTDMTAAIWGPQCCLHDSSCLQDCNATDIWQKFFAGQQRYWHMTEAVCRNATLLTDMTVAVCRTATLLTDMTVAVCRTAALMTDMRVAVCRTATLLTRRWNVVQQLHSSFVQYCKPPFTTAGLRTPLMRPSWE